MRSGGEHLLESWCDSRGENCNYRGFKVFSREKFNCGIENALTQFNSEENNKRRRMKSSKQSKDLQTKHVKVQVAFPFPPSATANCSRFSNLLCRKLVAGVKSISQFTYFGLTSAIISSADSFLVSQTHTQTIEAASIAICFALLSPR
jgi:hypothetical protein